MEETRFILRNSFCSISDFDDVIDEYKSITGKDYNFDIKDEIMMEILEKQNLLTEFRIVHVKKLYEKFITIISYPNYEEIKINYDSYKIDEIKKILSSEEDLEILISRINDIVFKKIKQFSI